MRKTGKRNTKAQRSSCHLRLVAAVVEALEPRKLLSSATFAAVTSYPIGSGGSSGTTRIAVADFNGDTDPNGDNIQDVAAVANGVLTIAYGNGDGTFGSPQTISNDISGDVVSAAYIDGDSLPDIVTDNYNTTSKIFDVYIFSNNGVGSDGDASFTKDQILTTSNRPLSINVADFRSDGRTDLVLTSSRSDSETGSVYDQVSVLLSNGDGTFSDDVRVNGTDPDSVYSVTVGDFNGDGNEDIAVAYSASNTVAVLAYDHDGTGRFTESASYTTDFSATAITSSGDELVLSNGIDKDIETVSAGSGGFSGAQDFNTAKQFSSVALADVKDKEDDEDSPPDLVAFYGRETVPIANSPTGDDSDFYGGAVSVFGNGGTGGSGTSSPTLLVPSQTFFVGNTDGGSNSVAIADVNGDGYPNILTAGAHGNSFAEARWTPLLLGMRIGRPKDTGGIIAARRHKSRYSVTLVEANGDRAIIGRIGMPLALAA